MSRATGVRRPSLEYTVVAADGGTHRAGLSAPEQRIEHLTAQPTRRRDLGFTITDGRATDEEAVQGTFRGAKLTRRGSRPQLPPSGRGESVKLQPAAGPAQTQALPARAPTVRFADSVMLHPSSGESSANGQSGGANWKTPRSARSRPRTARSNRSKASSRARTRASRSRSPDLDKEKDKPVAHKAGTRVTTERRLQQKAAHSVSGIRTRIRPNVPQRIRELDEASRTRWNVSCKLEYEERFSQGLSMVPRSEKIDWFMEDYAPPLSEAGIALAAERAATEEARAKSEELEKRLRRARCSTACANLFAENERCRRSPRRQEQARALPTCAW
mmetsp:Transcript_5/g.11  ORF Transcript_5/g.11 Transcript_5/m.11 type:complete len:331 (+) Transcript_5:69-1061(+)